MPVNACHKVYELITVLSKFESKPRSAWYLSIFSMLKLYCNISLFTSITPLIVN